jgi:hypothetical protein
MCDFDNATGKNNEGDLISLQYLMVSRRGRGAAAKAVIGSLGRAACAGTGPKSQKFLRRFF